MNGTMKTICSLRSVHGDFSARKIPAGDMSAILDAALRAANASARQSYSMVVLDDRDAMRRISGYSGDRMIVFCVDFSRLEDVGKRLGHDKPFVDFTAFVTGAIDTVLAAQTACVAARSLGVDSLFTNGLHRVPIDSVYAELALPERLCFPLIALVLGYPEHEPSFSKGRVSGRGIVHYGKYSPLSGEEIDSLVDEYDDPERHLGLYGNWKDDGYAHYLDWFYERWQGPAPADKNAEMKDRLAKSGFMA